MIKIYPAIEFERRSPYGEGKLIPKKILWQGMHTCVETVCSATKRRIIATLPSGHGSLNEYGVNLDTRELFCPPSVRRWFGEPLLESLTHPQHDEIEMNVEIFRRTKKVVILNTIDYLYGHSLLKLLNAERHLRRDAALGLVVIVQDFLRWMVPDGVAEVWTVRLPLSNARNYFPALHRTMENECKRFSQIYLSKAHSHPQVQNISLFTRTKQHEPGISPSRITFIWRDDRPWFGNRYLIEAAKRTGTMHLFRKLQNKKIVLLFKKLRKRFPDIRYTVAGAGIATVFPDWIDDQRTTVFSAQTERHLCSVYSQSSVIIGVHGSNMLLPSAHAGTTIDLMPGERWGNFAQDIIFQETDVRHALFRYRFVPISIGGLLLAQLIEAQLSEYQAFKKQMSV
ncbi:MAG: hypothetical protein HYV29_03135 [Ignavibacteriales bacterium]|nr:hypothetical protein [Ignavibacteriales bacterium]